MTAHIESSTNIPYATGRSTITLTKPAGVVEGDLLIAVIGTWATPCTVSLAGWTALASPPSEDGGSFIQHLLWKIAGPSEGSSYVFVPSSTQGAGALMLRVSGVDTAAPINARSTATSTSGTVGAVKSNTVIFAGVTTTVDDCLILGSQFSANAGPDPVPSGGAGLSLYLSWDGDYSQVYSKTAATAGAVANMACSSSSAERFNWTVAIAPGTPAPPPAYPIFVAEATASGTGSVTPALPTGATTGDLLIMHIEGEGEDGSTDAMSTPADWTLIGSVASGTDSTTDRTRCTLYWTWYDSASPPARGVADAGDHTIATLSAWRNVDPTTPFDVSPVSDTLGTNGTSHTSGGLTTVTDNCVVVLFVGMGDDVGASWTHAFPNEDQYFEFYYNSTSSGSDGATYAWGGLLETAGPTGTAAWTSDTTEEHATWLVALRPGEAPDPDPDPDPLELPFFDDFTGTNGAPWDPDKWRPWHQGAGDTITATIQGNAGVLTIPDDSYNRGSITTWLGDLTDFELTASVQMTEEEEQYPAIFIHAPDYTDYTGDYVTSSYTFRISPETNNVSTFYIDSDDSEYLLTSVDSADVAHTDKINIKIRVEGDVYKYKWWNDGDSEPGSWLIEDTDTDYPSGQVGISAIANGGTTNVWDNFSITELSDDSWAGSFVRLANGAKARVRLANGSAASIRLANGTRL